MLITVENVLTAAQLATAREIMKQVPWVDGKVTAGGPAVAMMGVEVDGRLATRLAVVDGEAASAAPATLTFCNPASELTEGVEAPCVGAPIR